MNTRAIAAISLNALAYAIFTVGLVSALTPSEGIPRLVDVILFVVVPLLLLATAFALSRARPAKILGAAGMAAISAATSWLLWLQYRTS